MGLGGERSNALEWCGWLGGWKKGFDHVWSATTCLPLTSTGMRKPARKWQGVFRFKWGAGKGSVSVGGGQGVQQWQNFIEMSCKHAAGLCWCEDAKMDTKTMWTGCTHQLQSDGKGTPGNCQMSGVPRCTARPKLKWPCATTALGQETTPSRVPHLPHLIGWGSSTPNL